MANQRISILVALDGADEGLKRANTSAERSLAGTGCVGQDGNWRVSSAATARSKASSVSSAARTFRLRCWRRVSCSGSGQAKSCDRLTRNRLMSLLTESTRSG
uniref:Uncharacterized protein n=1 Tax=Ralstonia solanacearum TaxID=305 RepID=A0A0S4UA04_RALSL|nr:protein of unknown function [Ralstonia solanacearum]